MKTYLQGLIIGGVMVFAFMVLVGQTGNNKKIKEDIWDLQDSIESLEKNLNRLKKEVRNKKAIDNKEISARIDSSGIGRYQMVVHGSHSILFDTQTGAYFGTKEIGEEYKKNPSMVYEKGNWEDKPIVPAYSSALKK